MTSLESLQQKQLQSGPIRFNESDLRWLLAHIGDLDGDIRDTLTYSLLERGFMSQVLTPNQQLEIATRAAQQGGLWQEIEQPQNDAVFLRSFTALLGALILSADAKQPFLSNTQRQTWFEWALKYLTLEQDRRGYVSGKGWAHAIAHGSDLLDAAIRHPQFPQTKLSQATAVVQQVLQATQAPFQDDEEERLAVVLQTIANYPTGSKLVGDMLTKCHQEFWTSYQQTPADIVGYYRVSTLKRVCEALYFLAPNMRQVTETEINAYFRGMGYR